MDSGEKAEGREQLEGFDCSAGFCGDLAERPLSLTENCRAGRHKLCKGIHNWTMYQCGCECHAAVSGVNRALSFDEMLNKIAPYLEGTVDAHARAEKIIRALFGEQADGMVRCSICGAKGVDEFDPHGPCGLRD